jgi:NADH dehydrogenase
VRVLLSVGHPILQRACVSALVDRGYQIRLLGSADDAAAWPAQVEPIAVPQAGRLEPDVLDGCGAAVIVDQSVTPRRGGAAGSDTTAALLAAAAAARVERVILVASGEPDKPIAERLSPRLASLTAGGYAGDWLGIHAPTVYGIGDDPVTLLLILMRSLPAVPLIDRREVAHPLWHEDLAAAIAAAPELESAVYGDSVELAGPDAVTPDDLYERLARAIDRRPLRVPVPEFVADYGDGLAQALGMRAPFDALRLQPDASTAVAGIAGEALTSIFGVIPTSLDSGLQRLIQQLPELTPDQGTGTLELKRFGADIRGSHYDAPALLRAFRRSFKDVMPIPVGVEPAAPAVELDRGTVITMTLPGRGHVSVRVEEVTDDHVLVATLRGHALAGVVRFSAVPRRDAIRFEVTACDAAANEFDWLTLTLGGALMQDANWTTVVKNVVTLSQGTADGVDSHKERLSRDQAREAEQSIAAIVERHAAARSGPADDPSPSGGRELHGARSMP